MANAEAGTAYVSIVPSMKGFQDGVAKGVKSALGTVAKLAGIAAVGKALADVGRQATEAYADYQQLTGGVEKIFGDSAGIVEGYAAQAYKTAGLSSNQYMTQVTSFSASLLQSMGGDTKAAADMANQAIVDMSDNANVYGSNIQDVQNAYQGFAKQNYTMLDNLKLGYGGTKSEMERLIKDANEWGAANGEASDLTIDSYADVIQAIHQIQEKQGITGDTAMEAAKTVSGSLAMVKAAWENWLSSVGSGEGVDTATQQLVESAATAARNLLPVVMNAVGGIVAAAPQFVAQIGAALAEALPTLGATIRDGLQGAWDGAQAAFSGIGIELPDVDVGHAWAAVDTFLTNVRQGFARVAGDTGVQDAFGRLSQSASDLLAGAAPLASFFEGPLATAIGQVAATAITDVVDGVASLIDGFNAVTQSTEFQEMWGKLQAAAQPFYENVLVPLGDFLSGPLASALGNIAGLVLYGIVTAITTVMEVCNDVSVAIQAVAGFFSDAATTASDDWQAVCDFFSGIPGAIQGFFSSIGGWLGDQFSGARDVVNQAGQGIVDFFRDIPGKIAGFFSSLHIELPHINLPHFTVSGSFNLDPANFSVPSLGVEWYATGGVFSSPRVIGVGDNRRYGEAVLPLSPKVLAGIGRGVAEGVGAGATVVNQTFNTRVVRSDQDIYAAAAIISRAAMRTAMGV